MDKAIITFLFVDALYLASNKRLDVIFIQVT